MVQLRVCMLHAAAKAWHSQKFSNEKLDLFASYTQPRASGEEWPRVVPEDLGREWGVGHILLFLPVLGGPDYYSVFSLLTGHLL